MVNVPKDKWPDNYTGTTCTERCFYLPQSFVDWLRDTGMKYLKRLANELGLNYPPMPEIGDATELSSKEYIMLDAAHTTYTNMIGKVPIDRFL